MNTITYADSSPGYQNIVKSRADTLSDVHLDHQGTSRLLGRLAGAFGVEITSTDVHYWQTVLTAARALDDVVDIDHHPDSSIFVDKLIRGQAFGSLSDNQAYEIKQVYDELSPERQQRLHRTNELATFAIKRYEATDTHHYMHHTLEESRIFGEVLMIDTNSSDDRERQAFNHWLYSLSRTAYAYDSLVDMADDYRHGVTQINPSLSVYASLAEIAYIESIDCIREAPTKVIQVLVKGMIAKKTETLKRK
jgi:hypothetical protein